MSTSQQKPRREYRSPRRQQQAAETRAAVLQVATRLFGERGWAATGMRDVAREAGVSVETVYSSFGSKSDLLMAAIDVAVVGDDEPVPLDRRTMSTALGTGTRVERFQAGARLLTEIHRRTAGVNLALREAAASDSDLAQLLGQRETGRHANVTEGMSLMAGREITPQEADALWAVTDISVYRMLTVLRGWTAQQYQDWIADTVARLVDDGSAQA
jgi:AcrR family transcriptional regulator